MQRLSVWWLMKLRQFLSFYDLQKTIKRFWSENGVCFGVVTTVSWTKSTNVNSLLPLSLSAFLFLLIGFSTLWCTFLISSGHSISFISVSLEFLASSLLYFTWLPHHVDDQVLLDIYFNVLLVPKIIASILRWLLHQLMKTLLWRNNNRVYWKSI